MKRQVKYAKVRYGKLVTDIVYSDLRPRRAIIFGYGLLGSPQRRDSPAIKRFVDSGFLVFLPRYYGTYESGGLCTFENAADSLLDTIKLVKKGRAKDAWGGTLRWRASQIVLAGGSFGAAAALVAGAKSDVKKIIAVAGPVDWRIKHGVAAYLPVWSIAYRNTWRCAKGAWKRLISGHLDLNAIDYVDRLRDKDVLLIHGFEDKVVSPKHSKVLFERLKGGSGNHKLIIIQGAGHSNIMEFLTRPRISRQIMEWLKTK